MIELMSFRCISEEVSNSDSLSNVDIYVYDVEENGDQKVSVDPIVSL